MDSLTRGKPFLIIILDGLALNPNPKGNAVRAAHTPVLDRLLAESPSTTLVTFGPRVGLPEGQMGNSEVGHLNIGGGRIVQQELTRINQAIEDRRLGESAEFTSLLSTVKSRPESALHLIGLLSTGGVHSSLEHVKALVEAAVSHGLRHVFIHAVTDGRDRPPTASVEELGELQNFLAALKKKADKEQEFGIATITGRYYAMDRDRRWERTELAYELFTEGKGEVIQDVQAALRARHAAGQTDEFLKPMILSAEHFNRKPTIQDGDALLFFNFRADRMRQIVGSFSTPADAAFDGWKRNRVPQLSRIATLTEYDEHLPVDVLFRPQQVKNHFGEVIAAHGMKQVRIAETEKYAHVTYFFNGGVETPCTGEERILVPSPRDVATYDLKPEMSAPAVTEQLLAKLQTGTVDVAIVNFANCDMVGHTGNFDAAVKAVETVDSCLGRVLEMLASLDGAAIVTADHGNADQMIDYETGAPHTFHTLYPVPMVIFGKQFQHLKLKDGGALCDIAPTACKLLGIPAPAEMTGTPLIAE
jgi:2,3-bisphosphoglycerate-independent phosphoglycerate mutase